jgi:uncharacterized membrane protein
MTAPVTETATATGTTSTGLAPNVAGALAYLLGPITGIAFLVLEKENRFVRFHAAQSTAVSVVMIVLSFALSILGGVLAVVPVLGWIIALLVSVGVAFVSFFLWLYLMWQAFQGRSWRAPVAGQLAEKFAP